MIWPLDTTKMLFYWAIAYENGIFSYSSTGYLLNSHAYKNLAHGQKTKNLLTTVFKAQKLAKKQRFHAILKYFSKFLVVNILDN